ncbi:hypothetical protein Ancab_034558 [Ancistrocladus abbreviatus]
MHNVRFLPVLPSDPSNFPPYLSSSMSAHLRISLPKKNSIPTVQLPCIIPGHGCAGLQQGVVRLFGLWPTSSLLN